MQLDLQVTALVGEHGCLSVAENDQVTRRLAMLSEGAGEGLGPLKAAEKYG